MTVVHYKMLKSRSLAIMLSLLLGGLGIHKFYLNQPLWGVIYLAFCWTFIPIALGVIEAIWLLCMNEQRFDQKFNT